ncbi:GIY-YIG nuclease family protein [Patescibacteria group bacterium]|nr:GIY-YIG nuclease family protein [Patescibacteria group bacterium]
MFTVYVLRSQKKKYFYVGLTNSILRRFNQHQNGKEKTTRSYCPFDLVYLEQPVFNFEMHNP